MFSEFIGVDKMSRNELVGGGLSSPRSFLPSEINPIARELKPPYERMSERGRDTGVCTAHMEQTLPSGK